MASLQPRRKRLKTAPQASSEPRNDLPSIPVLSCESVALNEDTMEEIVDYVNGDGASYCDFTAVSKGFNSALIPRQKKVWIGGFKSYKDFQSKGFVKMEFFSGRRSSLVTDAVLNDLGNPELYSKLRDLDLSGCLGISPEGTARVIEALGLRLRTFIMNLPPRSRIDTNGFINLVVYAKNLTSLSLFTDEPALCTLGSMLDKLSYLSILINGSLLTLPNRLPTSLETLRLHIVNSYMYWDELTRNLEPVQNLKTLEISDTLPAPLSEYTISANALISLMNKCPNLKTLSLQGLSNQSRLYLGEAEEEEHRLFQYLENKGIKYIGPTHVTRASGADYYTAEDGRFINNCDWIGRD